MPEQSEKKAQKQQQKRRYLVRHGRHVEVYNAPNVKYKAEGGETLPGLGGHQMVYYPGDVFETTRDLTKDIQNSPDAKFAEVSESTPLTWKDDANLPEWVPNGEDPSQREGRGSAFGHGLSDQFKDSPELKNKGKSGKEKAAGTTQDAPPDGGFQKQRQDVERSSGAAAPQNADKFVGGGSSGGADKSDKKETSGGGSSSQSQSSQSSTQQGKKKAAADEELEEMTVADLHDLAKEEEVPLHGASTKHEIVSAIKKHRKSSKK